MFVENEKKTYVIIKNDENWRPKFYVWAKGYGTVIGLLQNIEVDKKKITSTQWPNAWKEITIHNLNMEMVSTDWQFQVQLPLYSSIARSVLNALAGKDELDNIHLNIYNNKHGFRAISVRKSDGKDDYYSPKYTREEELSMIEMKIDKGEEKKDYDKLSDRYVKELLPIIKDKISKQYKEVKEEQKETTQDDDLPF